VGFEPASVHVPLPAIRVVPTSLSLGEVRVGGTIEQWISIHNDGEADLEVTVAAPTTPFAVGATSLTIPPHTTQDLALRFEPTAPGDASAVLLLATNDPDDPFVSIDVSGTGMEAPDAGIAVDAGIALDAGIGDASVGGDGGEEYVVMGGACGCRVGGQSPTPSAPIVLGLVALALRWRRRRADR
jgi:MYXO-CTERM domain-containing protein